MSAASTTSNVETAVEVGVQVNLSALGSALLELVKDPTKAAVDGNGALILKDAATVAKVVGLFVPAAAVVANDIELAAAVEPFVATGIAGLVALAKATGNEPAVMSALDQTLAGRFSPTEDTFRSTPR